MSGALRLRLDRLLSNLGYGSRREVRTLISRGLVTYKGAPLSDPENRLTVESDLSSHLLVDGEALDPLPGLTIMMNKPTGLSCSRREEGAIVYELLPERWRLREPALSTIGRLDKETSGLLLFTDDGDLLHRITSPKKEITKRYLAHLAQPLLGSEQELFASGTLLLKGEKKPLLPALLEVHSPTSVTVSLREGRYHQVRRMFAEMGNEVTWLRRESIGGLRLPGDLTEGQYRVLSADDLQLVFSG